MFTALPQETVFEARAQSRRDTVILVLLLLVVYVFCFGLMGFALSVVTGNLLLLFTHGWKLAVGGAIVGIPIALIQYFIARNKQLEELTAALWAKPADPKDEYHARFIQLVQEAETATGLHGIRVMVIPTPAMNAFSLMDGSGRMALGATEGLIGRLNRNELGGVVAHEAAHLVQGDSRLLTIAGALSSSFESIADALSPGGNRPVDGWSSSSFSRDRRGGGGIVILWLIALVGRFFTRFLSMALSRSREYLADAQAVRMTKNPLALAEALRKIAGKFRGGVDAPPGFQAVFILNPEILEMDESEDGFSNMFSTHPPVGKRIQRLLDWAKADANSLLRDEDPPAPSSGTAANEPRYFSFLENAWAGPYTFTQLLAGGQIRPDTWVCPEGGENVCKAGDQPVLAQLFTDRVQGTLAAQRCPHCHVPLVEQTYEGAPVLFCTFCTGYLVDSEVLERIVARREKTFEEAQVKKVLEWRKAQHEGALKDAACGAVIPCPKCGKTMSKAFHLLLTRVVVDRCPWDGCVWLDGGELEAIQILVEQSAQSAGWGQESPRLDRQA